MLWIYFYVSILIGNVIIPTDVRLFFRGVGIPPTRFSAKFGAPKVQSHRHHDATPHRQLPQSRIASLTAWGRKNPVGRIKGFKHWFPPWTWCFDIVVPRIYVRPSLYIYIYTMEKMFVYRCIYYVMIPEPNQQRPAKTLQWTKVTWHYDIISYHIISYHIIS